MGGSKSTAGSGSTRQDRRSPSKVDGATHDAQPPTPHQFMVGRVENIKVASQRRAAARPSPLEIAEYLAHSPLTSY